MGADMDADDSAEVPNIVVGPGETYDNYYQAPLKRIWTGFWNAFNMRAPVDEEPQYVLYSFTYIEEKPS
jgi:hypothetical protein